MRTPLQFVTVLGAYANNSLPYSVYAKYDNNLLAYAPQTLRIYRVGSVWAVFAKKLIFMNELKLFLN